MKKQVAVHQGMSNITIIVGLAALAALVAFFVVSVQRGMPADTVTPPVYVDAEPPGALIRPLYLSGVPEGGWAALSAEHKQSIATFKKKILARVASGMPLSNQEKTVLSISISTTTKPALGALIVADQSVLQFNNEERRLIDAALKR